MKYIDADKLIAEIERRIESWTIRGKHSPAGQGRDTCVSRVTELSDLLSFISSLQQEQPEGGCSEKPNNLPSNLDDAAEKYSENILANNEDLQDAIEDAYKAGAEWMAGQGASYITKVGWIDGPTVLDWPDDILDKFEMGDEVIVQIRKKYDL